ncbi:MAG: class I SAM-dependent methyltransferase [Gemmatimonadaceae bacterium]
MQNVGGEYRCVSCSAAYPIRYGIPDFRLSPDPYISVEAELAKIEKLLAPPAKSFRELLNVYYELSPENPPELNAHYIASMEGSVIRGSAILRKLRNIAPDLGDRRILDIGCGSAGLAVAASKEFAEVVGVDVALRWLLIGRQRLNESGPAAAKVALICANAEALPFRSAAFEAVVADAVIEHVRDSSMMRDETLRVLAGDGAFFFTTNNRYSVLPEPDVRILGFGLLPRRWMEKAALALRKTPYRTRLHSRRELRSVFKNVGRVDLPSYEPNELGRRNERARRIWDVLSRIPPIRWAMGPIVPQYFVSGRRTWEVESVLRARR